MSMKRYKLFLIPLVILLTFAVMLSGCMQSAAPAPTPSKPSPVPSPTTPTAPPAPSTPKPSPAPSPGGLSGKITEAGSTTVQPVAEKLAIAFKAINPNVEVIIQGGGSGVGVKSAADGTVDIGAVSRELTADEKKLVVEHVLAKDAIAIIAHPSQTVSNLTVEQVRDIFNGKITNWSQVGGSNKAIHVVSREEGSGTRGAFEEMVMAKTQIVATAILQPSNGAVRTTVAGDPDSIAYISLGYLDSSVKAVNINGVAPTAENAKSGRYPIVRPLLFVTKGQPTGLVKEFINFALGPEGQKIVAKDYIPVN